MKLSNYASSSATLGLALYLGGAPEIPRHNFFGSVNNSNPSGFFKDRRVSVTGVVLGILLGVAATIFFPIIALGVSVYTSLSKEEKPWSCCGLKGIFGTCLRYFGEMLMWVMPCSFIDPLENDLAVRNMHVNYCLLGVPIIMPFIITYKLVCNKFPAN